MFPHRINNKSLKRNITLKFLHNCFIVSIIIIITFVKFLIYFHKST